MQMGMYIFFVCVWEENKPQPSFFHLHKTSTSYVFYAIKRKLAMHRDANLIVRNFSV